MSELDIRKDNVRVSRVESFQHEDEIAKFGPNTIKSRGPDTISHTISNISII